MDAQRWQKIKGLFDAAVELDERKRAKFLINACTGDDDLLHEVEKMLDSFEGSESFLEAPAAEAVADLILDSDAKLTAGQTIGHYEIVRQLGVGGMGEVYLAKDSKLDRSVAIKILNEKFSAHQSNLERFTREAKAASALNHPNILVIHEIGETGKTNYIVSEFVTGKTLRTVVKESPLNVSEIIEIAVQIASALAAAHGEHIIHRDIKPENIMVRPDGYIKVLDFGLAKLIGSENSLFGLEDETKLQNQTAKGVIMGTVNYMSPEQAKGETVDERTDIFSLGVLMYEMIAGLTPFQADTVSETFANLIKTEAQPLSRFAANAPDELQRIVLKTLRKKKDDRYQTMKDLITDLKDLRDKLLFDEKIERSRVSGEENATAVYHPSTGEVSGRTAETSAGWGLRGRQFRIIPAAILLVMIAGLVGGYYMFVRPGADPSATKKTLAVLPFSNLTQDPNAEYLSDGVAESIINNLSAISSLSIKSRNSSFRFKNDQTDIAKIGSLLGVETLVTGDIKQIGDKFVINVRLINAKDDSQIWGTQYVKASGDLIAAQNEIAQAVAQNLRLRLTATDQQKIAKVYTQNPEAYQLYMQGQFHVFKLIPDEVNRGIANFQRAIELDPNYAMAYTGLSTAYRSLAVGAQISPSENLQRAGAAAQKAIDLDPDLAEGHTALATSLMMGRWEWAKAEAEYTRAIDLDPSSGISHIFYAQLLSCTGRHTEALAEAKRANEIEPLWPFAASVQGLVISNAGQTDEAIAKLRQAYDLDPQFWMPHLFVTSALINKGLYDEAIVEAHKTSELGPAQSQQLGYECYALAKAGRRDEALLVLDGLTKRSSVRYVPQYHFALSYMGLGDRENALASLEKAYEQHDAMMIFLKVESKWQDLRSEPRFIELMKKMNLNN